MAKPYKSKPEIIDVEDLDEGTKHEKAEPSDFEFLESEPDVGKNLLTQVKKEVEVSRKFLRPKWNKWLVRLKLLNNQKRNDTDVGDPLLYTVMSTYMAGIYDDRLQQNFVGREEGDQEMEEDLNALAEYDYEAMRKAQLDYDWDFDTGFFGRGLMLMEEFDATNKRPAPEVVDPFTFLRDPRAVSANGDANGRGALRFWGREIRLTKREMAESGVYDNYETLTTTASNTDPYALLDQAKRERDAAQGRNVEIKQDVSEQNQDYLLIEWRTWWKDTRDKKYKRILITTDSNFGKVLRFQVLDNQDNWQLVDRSFSPTAHDWDGVSIPDLVEDKQRMRAKILNLAAEGVEAGLYPTYFYNTTLIKNKASLNYDKDRFVGVDGNPQGVVDIMPRSVVKTEVDWILNALDTSTQRATASPAMRQGITGPSNRTATEMQQVSQGSDARYSLTARVFGWSEREFWMQWYWLYKNYFGKGMGEKIVRIVGFDGAKWRGLTRENIIMKTDPDVYVESKTISEAKRHNDLQVYANLAQAVLSDPNANRRYALKKMAKLSGLKHDEINYLLPPTPDELHAQAENDQMNDGKNPVISITDNHSVHYQEHLKAKEGDIRDEHLKAHREAMMMLKQNPELAMKVSEGAQAAMAAGSPNPMALGGQNPMENVSYREMNKSPAQGHGVPNQ